ncbi:glycosyltransferase [Carboxylicivirga marina]|uniref:glycosyltransferase n=1 Tax=Carboxylicivirga marina TaxID=2800988 RepID=UPI0025955C2A|nr:glycosyltransferase [uncultured Carboxylicivirga sp.]
MNILFVCSAKAWGGNEKWTSMAMKALSNEHKVMFIGKMEALRSRFGGYYGTSLPFRSYADAYTFKQLKSFILKNKIDIIVSTKKKEYFLCGIISRQLGVKHIIRLGADRKMNIPLWHSLNYQKLNDGLIVNSHHIAKHLQEYSFFKNHPIHVLYNGIPGFNSDSPHTNRPVNADKFVIVSSGRITKLKGYELLIDAIARLDESIRKKLEVRIIGEGRNKRDFELQCQRLGLDSIVHFTGFLDNPTALMKDADLFVLLSEREGLSNSILEAMTLGIPVLSTDTGGIKELIEDGKTGYLVARETEAVAKKITDLVHKQGSIQQSGKRAYKLLQQNFAFDVFEENINKLIQNI